MKPRGIALSVLIGVGLYAATLLALMAALLGSADRFIYLQF
jgi:hypothetical protein